MCKYTIELWYVDKLDTDVYVGKAENYCSDNLVEVLKFLRFKEVFFFNLNQFKAGEYSLESLKGWGSRTYFANVYLRDKLLKFHKLDFYQKGFPSYTACGYKIKPKQVDRKIKYNYGNVKHRVNAEKDYFQCFIEASEIIYSEYNIPNKDITKLKKKNFINNSWDLYEKVRSRNSMSWKNQKKRRQWQ